MARRRRTKSSGGIVGLLLLVLGVIEGIIIAMADFISENSETLIAVGIIILLVLGTVIVVRVIVNIQRKKLLKDILIFLNLQNIDSVLCDYDDIVIVKSQQSLGNYTDLKYLKEKNVFENIIRITNYRKQIYESITSFLKTNDFEKKPQYKYVKKQLDIYLQKANGYKVLINYITSAGNNRGSRIIHIDNNRVNELISHPELLMSKVEYNKLLKQQSKDELEEKKHAFYDRVNLIIERGNNSKDKLVIKSNTKKMDELITKLFDRTVNSIQKIKDINSDEWGILDSFISNIDQETKAILEEDNRLSSYYKSSEFSKLKDTCDKLMQSQKDFNEYIEEKANSISQLFGTRIVRNETQNEDTYNYLRAYKKTITPFTAEVSSTVFSSAENSPIAYIIKYFYPNKTQYKEQIEKLRLLISELETLKEAKDIIENYKKDYADYIKDVPSFVLEKDESGFYSRLGLATIDESVLNIEYKFAYTSDGGMAQRSFTVPMSEENIIELINELESKLSFSELAKEQRALMTKKLRQHIKERDNYTCCQCENSTHKEPNLLLEIDHIIPIAKGGLTAEDNLQTLCWKCNRSKGAKLL